MALLAGLRWRGSGGRWHAVCRANSGEVESARKSMTEALASFIGAGAGRGHGRGLARRGMCGVGR
jgi:hypothetical protein